MTAARTIYDWFAGLDPRLWQAVIAGLFVQVGWIVNGAQNRREAARLRRERRDDVQRAVVAEIKHYMDVLEGEDFDEVWQDMEARIASSYVPFLPTESNDMVFQSVLADLHVLPREVIDPVVKYYSQLRAIEVLIDDSRQPDFTLGEDAEARDRRAAMYCEYLQMKHRARRFGRDALSELGARGVSSPVVAHSGQ